MPTLKVGNTEVEDVRVGSTEVQSVYAGSTEVWSRGTVYSGVTSYSQQSGNWYDGTYTHTYNSLSLTPTAFVVADSSGNIPNIHTLQYHEYELDPSNSYLEYEHLNFVVDGLVPNSGWDSIHTVRSGQTGGSHFYRSDASYSQSNGKTYWQWDITSNPFGIYSNQTYIITIKN